MTRDTTARIAADAVNCPRYLAESLAYQERLEAENERLRGFVERLADADYRGPQPWHIAEAQRVLAAIGERRAVSGEPDAREVIARILHQHGPTPAGPATDDWRDCPSADIHGDVAMRIADALGLEVRRMSRLDAGRAAEAVQVVANAIAYAWLTTVDPTRRTTVDHATGQTSGVEARDVEIRAARAAAERALAHFAAYRAGSHGHGTDGE